MWKHFGRVSVLSRQQHKQYAFLIICNQSAKNVMWHIVTDACHQFQIKYNTDIEIYAIVL